MSFQNQRSLKQNFHPNKNSVLTVSRPGVSAKVTAKVTARPSQQLRQARGAHGRRAERGCERVHEAGGV